MRSQGKAMPSLESGTLTHADTICRVVELGGFLYQRIDINLTRDLTMTLLVSSMDLRWQKLTKSQE